MITHTLNNQTIHIGTKEECRELWRSQPEVRHLIWSEEEFDVLMDADKFKKVWDDKQKHRKTVGR